MAHDSQAGACSCTCDRDFLGCYIDYYFIIDGVIIDLGYKHFITIFGLPAAAAAALAVVMITRAISGQMAVEFLGLKFRGAASEAIIWVICFLAITYAVKSTWSLQYVPEPPWVTLGGRR